MTTRRGFLQAVIASGAVAFAPVSLHAAAKLHERSFPRSVVELKRRMEKLCAWARDCSTVAYREGLPDVPHLLAVPVVMALGMHYTDEQHENGEVEPLLVRALWLAFLRQRAQIEGMPALLWRRVPTLMYSRSTFEECRGIAQLSMRFALVPEQWTRRTA